MRYPLLMGQSDRDPLFFPPAKYGNAEEPGLAPPEVNTEAQEKRLRVLVLLGVVVMVMLLFAVQSGPVREAWNHLMGRAPGTALNNADLSKVLNSPPQRQAEQLLRSALNGDTRAAALIQQNASSWSGTLQLTPQLNGMVLRALDSRDPRLCTAGMETYLAGYTLSRTPDRFERVLATAENDPQHRAWALFTLGILGNRGTEPGRARQAILAYLHDPEEWTRLSALDGLSMLGSEDVIAPMLEVLHNDPSPKVRERAASDLAHKGMMPAETRRLAVPVLIEYAADGSLDAQTRAWVFAALRDITGQPLPDDAAKWRAWYSGQNGS